VIPPPRSRSFRCLVPHSLITGIALAITPAICGGQLSGVTDSRKTPSFVRETWTARDGLPINSITQIIQSRTGYIWLATFDGLVRFDGVKFTVFNTANSEGIPSNRIVRVFETRDTTLWAVSEAGQLVKYRNGRFTTIRRADHSYLGLTALHEDNRGNVWFATGHGVGIVRGDSINLVAPSTISGQVFGIAESRDGTIWVIGAPGGLYRVSGNRADTVAGAAEMLSHLPTIISVDSADGVWIGTGHGVYRFKGSLTRVQLAGTNGTPGYSVDKNGGIWASSGGHVFRLGANGAERVFTAGPSDHNGSITADAKEHRVWYGVGPDVYLNGVRVDHGSSPLGLPNIVTMLVDREGSLWLGTTSTGLIRLKSSLFTTFGVPEGLGTDNAFVAASDRSGTVWTGLNDFNVAKISADHATFAGRTNTPVSGVASILEDHTGRMWFGADACDRLLEHCTSPPSGLMRGEVRAIHEEPDGTMWFGTGDGLFRLNGNNWHRFTPAERPPAAPVRAFARTPDGALWMGTNGGGLSRFKDGRFTPLSTAQGLPSDLVRALLVDTDGFLWIGTEGMGLARIDPRDWGPAKPGSRIVSIRQKDGLFDNGIHQILDDELGSFWMSTNRGIFWVKRDELNAFAAGRIKRVRSTSYDERDGLRNREANGGSQPAGTRTPDGRLWFPTQAGIAVIDPRVVHSKTAAPNVVIERVVAGDSTMNHLSSTIALGPSQRDVEIDYTALSFLAPERLRFRYRLDPYDQDWTDADTRRSAFYTRVPPGHYTFQVAATNDAGVWTGSPATLSFDISPRFYETRWFIAMVVLSLGVLAWVTMRLRVNRLYLRARELQLRVDERTAELRQRESLLAAQNTRLETQAGQLKELDRAKSRFFANVSHEFRTPLTLTIGPLEDARAQLVSGDGSDAVSRIDMALRSARRLFGLVTQVLDVAKLEAGQMKLHAKRGDLVVFARGVASSFTSLAERMRIAFELRAPSAEVVASFDPDAMEKVIANLLSNAFKFTPEGGRITLSIEGGAEGFALIRVEDSGPGIPEAELEHVFERFYQVDESNTRSQTGTGIGLSLARELVELHGGTISVASAPMGGAVFTVKLPVDLSVADPIRLEELHAGNGVGPTDGKNGDQAERSSSMPADDVTTLLVVDDSADMRAYIRARFEPRYRVLEGSDGNEGLARARESLPDLVISDVVMPGMNGHELFDALRSNPETDFIPVILLTAQAEGEQRIAGLDRGADDYIVKPFDMRELEARADNLIASRRRLRERFSASHVRLGSSTSDGKSPADREFLDKLTAALEAGLADPDFGVAELASAVFQDRTNLFRRTRSLLNETPSDLLRRVRLERASKLLVQGDDGIADIAYGVGFNSVSAFCRAFREAYQMTPSSFRESKKAPR
jgi:signal transduction histidine kinase/ligand-binding sensor domain-containing protein/CheY-like chemotaxis protein